MSGVPAFDPAEFAARRALRDNQKSEPSQPGGSSPNGEKRGATRGSELDRQCAFLARTDLGNAERFKLRFGDEVRWCPEIGWHCFDDRRWNVDEYAVVQRVYDTVRAIRDEAEFIKASGCRDSDDADDEALDFVVEVKSNGKIVKWSDQIRGWALASESASKLACIANLAKPWLEVKPETFDAEPMAINVLNGTLRFELAGDGCSDWVARLDPHRREDMLTKLAPVEYQPAALCPAYDRAMERWQPDAAMRRFLHAWTGYNLTGDISEHKIAIHYGGGSNGKSTMVETHAYIAGDYATAVPIETFLDQGRQRRGGDATPEIAKLPGVRFLRTSEPEQGAKLAEALIKLATGGEVITARHLHARHFLEFTPQFKLSISTNHMPQIRGSDDGIWRRVQLVPWGETIAERDKDRNLPLKLRLEASGVFNRMIDGLLDWKAGGLPVPGAVTEATAEYRTASDPLGRFIEECAEIDPGARTQAANLHATYLAWAKAAGESDRLSAKGLSLRMADRGFEKEKSSAMYWKGLRLVKSPLDFGSGAPHPSQPGANDE